MNYVVAYDIADDRTRLRIAKILDGYGDRVQDSVFELPDVSEPLLNECLSRLEREVPLQEGDSIRVYPLCEACRRKIRSWGTGRAMDNPDGYFF